MARRSRLVAAAPSDARREEKEAKVAAHVSSFGHAVRTNARDAPFRYAENDDRRSHERAIER
jgi:hypothetical protein